MSEPWNETAFARSLTAGHMALPNGLRVWNGSEPAKRFSVYRNNVRAALVEALAVRYPVVQRLVGEDFFRVMARDYALNNLPPSPVLIGYGESFPAFITGFEPAATLPYLADVARLESAYWQAYHAADDAPLPAEAFAAIDPQTLAATKVTFLPSVFVLTSPHPIVSIWQTNAADADVKPVDLAEAEDALVSRPALTVEVRKLPVGASTFLSSLQSGAALGQAAAAAMEAHAGFDLSQNLAGLIQARLAKAIS